MTEKTKTVLFAEIKLARTAQKDRAATKRLLERLYPKICQVVWSVVRTKEQAEEIEQAAILEVLKYLGKYRGEGSLEAWAGEITYRTAMKLLKQDWRWDKTHVPIVTDFEVSSDGPERIALKEQLYRMLADKMTAIPEDQRTAFLLHILEGYSVDEVSTIMNVSTNTTKYRLKVAVKEMRVIFNQNPEFREVMREVKK